MTLRKLQRGPRWNPYMVYARTHAPSCASIAKQENFPRHLFGEILFPHLHLNHGWGEFEMPRNDLFWYFSSSLWLKKSSNLILSDARERLFMGIFFLTITEEILNLDTLGCPGTTYLGNFHLWLRKFGIWCSQMSRIDLFWYFLSSPWLMSFCNLMHADAPRAIFIIFIVIFILIMV